MVLFGRNSNIMQNCTDHLRASLSFTAAEEDQDDDIAESFRARGSSFGYTTRAIRLAVRVPKGFRVWFDWVWVWGSGPWQVANNPWDYSQTGAQEMIVVTPRFIIYDIMLFALFSINFYSN